MINPNEIMPFDQDPVESLVRLKKTLYKNLLGLDKLEYQIREEINLVTFEPIKREIETRSSIMSRSFFNKSRSANNNTTIKGRRRQHINRIILNNQTNSGGVF